MKFSLCSWVFGDLAIEDVIRFAAKTGYDEVEVGTAVDAHDWTSIKQTAKKENINIRGINADASFLKPETDLANPDVALRNEAIAYFKRQLEIGEYLEAEYMVLAPAAPGRSIPALSREEDWSNGVDSIKQLAPFANELGIQIVIEPLNRYENCLVYNADTASYFLQAVDEPNVKTMLDTFHMNIDEANFIDPFTKLKGRLETVHVADSNRRGLGKGHLPFEEVVKAIKQIDYDKTITVESLAPGGNPFEATSKQQLNILFKDMEESLTFLKNYF